MKFQKIAAAALAGLMAVSMAACGSSSTASTDSTAASSAAASAAATTTSTTSDSFTTVEAGKLHMATNAAFPPYESTTDNGGYEGIDIDIATAIAEKLGLELVVDDMDFGSVITSVQNGQEDIAMAGLTINEERKKNVDFTDTYATTVQSIVVKEDSDITGPDDLEGKLIGCQEGTTGYEACSEEFGEDNTIAYSNGAVAIQALLTDKVDAVVIDEEPAKAYVAANEGLKVLDTAYDKEEYAIGVSKDNPGLREAVNAALDELKNDGTVQSVLDKYITVDTASTAS